MRLENACDLLAPTSPDAHGAKAEAADAHQQKRGRLGHFTVLNFPADLIADGRSEVVEGIHLPREGIGAADHVVLETVAAASAVS